MNLSCCWSGSRRKRGLGTQGTGPMRQPAARGHSGRCPLLMDPTREWGGRRASGSLWTPLTAAAGMAHGPRRLWVGTARVTHLYSRCTPVARRCRRASAPCHSPPPQPQLASHVQLLDAAATCAIAASATLLPAVAIWIWMRWGWGGGKGVTIFFLKLGEGVTGAGWPSWAERGQLGWVGWMLV